jgi:hypothetical protein
VGRAQAVLCILLLMGQGGNDVRVTKVGLSVVRELMRSVYCARACAVDTHGVRCAVLCCVL